jgi:hypothetical protein
MGRSVTTGSATRHTACFGGKSPSAPQVRHGATAEADRTVLDNRRRSIGYKQPRDAWRRVGQGRRPAVRSAAAKHDDRWHHTAARTLIVFLRAWTADSDCCSMLR